MFTDEQTMRLENCEYCVHVCVCVCACVCVCMRVCVCVCVYTHVWCVCACVCVCVCVHACVVCVRVCLNICHCLLLPFYSQHTHHPPSSFISLTPPLPHPLPCSRFPIPIHTNEASNSKVRVLEVQPLPKQSGRRNSSE